MSAENLTEKIKQVGLEKNDFEDREKLITEAFSAVLTYQLISSGKKFNNFYRYKLTINTLMTKNPRCGYGEKTSKSRRTNGKCFFGISLRHNSQWSKKKRNL